MNSGGVYTILLIVTSSDGCSDTVSHTIEIIAEQPIADFTPIDTSGCPPLNVLFNNNSM